jgi:K+-sensing histidine kinase KdpD
MKKYIHFPSFRQIVQSLLSAFLVLILTLVMAVIGRGILAEGVITLLYLVPIAWCTVRWGKLAGVAASLTAALAFDFFFIQPLYTFNISSIEGWLLLVIFMAASIIIVGRVQSVILNERNREHEATFMYELVAAISNLQTREAIARVIANQIQQQYQTACVQVNLKERSGLPAILKTSSNSEDLSIKKQPDHRLPIYGEPDLIGEIMIWTGSIPFPSENDYLLQSFVRQTALNLKRAQTNEEAGSASSLPG